MCVITLISGPDLCYTSSMNRYLKPNATALGAVALAALVSGGLAAWVGEAGRNAPMPQEIRVSPVNTTTNVIEPMPGLTVPRARGATAGPNTGTGQLNSAQQQLINILPAGYGPDSCQPVEQPVRNAVATVDCFDNSMPGGPAAARYSLFKDAQALAASFHNGTLNQVTVTPCPNGGSSPGEWVYGSATEVAGEKMCGTDPDNNNATVGWTENSLLLQGVAEGPNLDALYNWWMHPSGPTSIRS
jgi:serine/threonine kinase PknH